MENRYYNKQKRQEQDMQELIQEAFAQEESQKYQNQKKKSSVSYKQLLKPTIVYVKRITQYGNPLVDIIYPSFQPDIYIAVPKELQEKFKQEQVEVEGMFYLFQFVPQENKLKAQGIIKILAEKLRKIFYNDVYDKLKGKDLTDRNLDKEVFSRSRKIASIKRKQEGRPMICYVMERLTETYV